MIPVSMAGRRRRRDWGSFTEAMLLSCIASAIILSPPTTRVVIEVSTLISGTLQKGPELRELPMCNPIARGVLCA